MPHDRRKQVLFLQGSGQGAHTADEELAASLQRALGAGYEVHYPHMPEEAESDAEWGRQIGQEIDAIKGPLILVAHSFGASALLKYLAENQPGRPTAGIFLIATPYWGDGGWQYEGFTMPSNFSESLPPDTPIFLYHNHDDEVVPFDHLALYAGRLPRATTREGDTGGHQFSNGLTLVAQDIENLG
jgi:predicted alpha/beta hydrolase family esterase